MIISIQGIPQRSQRTSPACLENYFKQRYTPLGLAIKLWEAYCNEPTFRSDTELFLSPIKVTLSTRPKFRLTAHFRQNEHFNSYIFNSQFCCSQLSSKHINKLC